MYIRVRQARSDVFSALLLLQSVKEDPGRIRHGRRELLHGRYGPRRLDFLSANVSARRFENESHDVLTQAI